LRAILFASLAQGKSVIKYYLKSPDVVAMVDACRKFGAVIEVDDDEIKIDGVGGKPDFSAGLIDAGNSGQVLRFVTAIAALQVEQVEITGDHSICHNRPMQPLIDGLVGLGAHCVSTKNDGCAPIVVKGLISAGKTKLSGEDSQPVSALLMAAAFLKGQTEITVINPGEKPWIDLTLSWLAKIGVKVENFNYEKYIIYGNAAYSGFEHIVPGDFSSILFPVVAALITKSAIKINYVDKDDVQGDKKVIDVLISMGAKIEYVANSLIVHKTEKLIGREIDINDFIDAVTILAVVGCYADGKTVITGGEIARRKECDRISAIAAELKKMGANITETADGLIIESSKLTGARVQTYHDHRMVMSLSVAGLIAEGKTVVEDIASVAKSYPDFYRDMQQLGANILVQE
jgi:3-phosphoshikimate 1-carboxyvinyltransferase